MINSMGKALRETLAEAKGIERRSQNGLASAANVARSTVNQWMNGVSDPLTETTVRIAHVLYNQYGHDACELFLNKLFRCADSSFEIKLARRNAENRNND